ncbi:MAG: hypothetical protein A3J69_02670 [Candidatus Levybacteria bacterium RIFCSPHIGHO2_02_FULL_42_12]|nr:MAG: hypothetical protein A3J69_02670 [Candidatus Levybacteria bacterium RIFCSPHIGHO2_02_FULL_42_12]OGH43083.1 MAG: hypothetical protein A3B53_03150 [Candidatus Levybacteria bacterium RIFCSPLOWO2_01_FULL_42_15]
MRKRNRVRFITPLLVFLLLAYSFYFIAPATNITIPIGTRIVFFPFYLLFLALLFLFVFLSTSLFFKTKRYASYVGIFVAAAFLFKILEVTHIMLFILLLFLFGIMEIIAKKRS